MSLPSNTSARQHLASVTQHFQVMWLQGHATLESQLSSEQGLGVQIPPPHSQPVRGGQTFPAATQAASRHSK